MPRIVVPDDPLAWLPQRPLVTRVPVPIRDPVVEPLWSGTRVLAHIDTAAPAASRVRLMDDLALEITQEQPRLAAELADALLAQDAIVDGIITPQATRGGEGAAIVTEARMGPLDALLSRESGVQVSRQPDADGPTEDAFVAVDLLRLDGQSLLDVPLMERKRLLESALAQGPRVRVSVVCRPPVDAWIASWQGVGLRGGMLKAANGRYIPGDRTPEWRAVTRVAARR